MMNNLLLSIKKPIIHRVFYRHFMHYYSTSDIFNNVQIPKCNDCIYYTMDKCSKSKFLVSTYKMRSIYLCGHLGKFFVKR